MFHRRRQLGESLHSAFTLIVPDHTISCRRSGVEVSATRSIIFRMRRVICIVSMAVVLLVAPAWAMVAPLVCDHLASNLLTIDEMDSLRDAAKLLKRARITGAPVVDGASLSGILSRNDLLRAIDKIPSGVSDADFDRQLETIQQTEVWQVMTSSPVTIPPDATLLVAARTMQEKKLNRLMVKSQYSPMLGILSSTDIVFTLLGCDVASAANMDTSKYLLQGSEDLGGNSEDGLCSLGTAVHSHMTSSLFVMRPDMSLEDAAQLLQVAKVTGAPVVDSSDQAVGIVSRNDLLKALATSIPPEVEAAGANAVKSAIKDLQARRVSDFMNNRPVTVSADAPMLEAAKIMANSKLNRLMVTSPVDGKLCGILSSIDVVFSMLGCAYTLEDNDDNGFEEEEAQRRKGNMYRKGIY